MQIFPMKYVKIVPLSAFGANFNYSIWYVEIRGINEESVIQRVCSEYENVSYIVLVMLYNSLL